MQRIFSFLSCFVFLLLATGCTTEAVKPENNWTVRVNDAQLVGNSAYVPKTHDETIQTAAAPQAPQHIWVWHPDGSKQCDQKKGIDPERLATAVKKRGISVFEYRSSHDDKRHPMICGAITGRTVELEIASKDLAKARKLGLLEKSTAN